MGLFKEIFAQFIDVIEYQQEDSNVLVYKFPIDTKQQIENGAQLIVRPSQVAILVYEGQITDVYEPGKHTLKTDTMPITTALQNWKYGFNSPFKTDVYFVSTAMHLNNTWGTTSPLLIRDADFGTVQLRAHGKFSFKVAEPKKLLVTALNSTTGVTVEAFIPQLKSTIVSSIKDYLATSQIPVLDVATQFTEFGEEIQKVLQSEFNELALEVTKFIIEDVSLPEEVQNAINKRTTIKATGNLDDLMKYETANSIKDFAKNEGGLAGLGASVAMGASVAQQMGGLFNQNSNQQTNSQEINNNTQQQTQQAGNKFCTNCGASLSANSKFCGNCGASQNAAKVCGSCKTEVKDGQKFCENCGGQIG